MDCARALTFRKKRLWKPLIRKTPLVSQHPPTLDQGTTPKVFMENTGDGALAAAMNSTMRNASCAVRNATTFSVVRISIELLNHAVTQLVSCGERPLASDIIPVR